MTSDGSGHDIIVIGGSAGGVEALKTIVAGLTPDLPAAVFGVIHVSAHTPRLLDSILNREGGIPCSYATDGESIQKGRMYLAQPARHLLLEDGRMRVVYGPKENRAIPAIDPLSRLEEEIQTAQHSAEIVRSLLTDIDTLKPMGEDS